MGNKMDVKIKSLEEKFLVNENHFTKDQIDVINSSGNIEVIAGPGTGKTTVLSAKVCHLLSNQGVNNKGICCITHTNVAVDEIKERVKRVGISGIEYPNFVGTIQDFAYHFFASKAINLLNCSKSIQILDGEDYNEKFLSIFNNIKPSWFTTKYINAEAKNPQLIINNPDNVLFRNDAKKNYSSAFEKTQKELFFRGIFNSPQIAYLADWYVNKYIDKIPKAVEERFDYILLDEAQDTSNLQYKLLMDITKNSTLSFQRFGDPYQSLYSIYSKDKIDAWNPTKEIRDGIACEKSITATSRFGPTITRLVKNVCFEPFDDFESNIQDSSFPNYFFTYDSSKEFIKKHDIMINNCCHESTKFKKCKNKDMVVGVTHSDIKSLFRDYSKNANEYKYESVSYNLIFRQFVKYISYLNGRGYQEEINLLREDVDRSELYAEAIRNLYNREGHFNDLVYRLVPIENDKSRALISKLEDYVNNRQSSTVLQSKFSNDNDFSLSTIHSVKGETHRSTTLILDSKIYFSSNNQENNFFDVISRFLVGDRINYQNLEKSEYYKAGLKLAYVAFSRPKFVDAVAIPENKMNDKYRKELLDYGWKEVE